ncbi:hypothetical protein [Pseudomonas fluorescens]
MTVMFSNHHRSNCVLVGSLAVVFAGLPVFAHAYEAVTGAPKSESVIGLPKGYRGYGATPFEGGECVGGDVTQEGMNGRATVYVDDPVAHQIKWVKTIPLPPRRYQNRATHCVAFGHSLFVLVQTDTHQQTSLSQTLLSVARLSSADGAIETTRDEELPGVEEAYSAWVDKGAQGFQEVSGQLKITGQYRLMHGSNKRIPFTMSVSVHDFD